jgi:hypothetical protein
VTTLTLFQERTSRLAAEGTAATRRRRIEMIARSYTLSLSVNQTPAQVFAAINNVREWWPEIEGRAERVGAIFKHRFENLHRCELVVKDLIPDKKVVWSVLDNYFSFTEDHTEWKGTEIVFEIARKGDKTVVKFTHVGLVPEYECFGVCTDGWRSLIDGSLYELIRAA